MSLIAELKRRNVFRVAVFYVVTAWLTLQVVDVVGEIIALNFYGGELNNRNHVLGGWDTLLRNTAHGLLMSL